LFGEKNFLEGGIFYGEMYEENCPGGYSDLLQQYKIRPAVMISATLVNTQTHTACFDPL